MGKKKQAHSDVSNVNQENESVQDIIDVQSEQHEGQIEVSKEGKRRKNKQVETSKAEKKQEISNSEMDIDKNSGNEEKINNITVEKKNKNVKVNKALVITAIILVGIAIALVVFAVINKLNDKVYNNVYLNGVDLSGKTENEIAEYLKKLNEDFKSNTLVIKSGDKEILEITPSTIDMFVDEIATKAKIMAYGRDKDLLTNNINIVKAWFEKQEIEIAYQYSDGKLNNIAKEVATSIEDKVIDDSFIVDEKNNVLIITRGKTGKNIVQSEFKSDVLDALKISEIETYSLKLEDATPKALDVDVVYAQVAKDAKNAYVDETITPAVYHKHELGITFDKTELRNILAKQENNEEGKVIEFNLVTTKPEVTIQDITKHLYQDTLGKYTSSYENSDKNRASNVALGAKMLNGTIVMPGETFSFNKVMGDCGLSSRGFKPAAVFKQGKVEQEIGGGVCQISSTLYVAALYANMSIVSRKNHGLPVGYVPASLDATVYYPYLDFKFKNTREYPVKIVATTTSSRKLTISICGTKEDVEYEIELTSKKTGSIEPKVQKKEDSSLASGKTKVIQAGAYGYTSVAYKTVKLNGKVVSKTLLSEDKYDSTPKIIAVGTKEVNIYGE